MDEVMAVRIHAEARVERGTATHCACGAELALDVKTCPDCGREYT